MKIRNRILYLHQPEGETTKVPVTGDLDDLHELDSRKSLFDCLLNDLYETLRGKVGRSEGYPTWPNVAWCEDGFECHVSNWTAEEFIDERLAQIKFVEHVGDVTWTLKLRNVKLCLGVTRCPLPMRLRCSTSWRAIPVKMQINLRQEK